MACCNPHEYNSAFDHDRAQQELQDYRQTGLKKSSQPFMAVLETLPVSGKSLLDIGGGIGGITFELFKKGIRAATHIDISRGSVEMFRSEVKRQSLDRKVKSLSGDFLEFEGQITAADLVVLDKVICCYQNFEQLVRHSVDKALQWYVYSIPRDRWFVRAYFLYGAIVDRIRGKYLPVYFHPHKDIEGIVSAAGFRKTSEKLDGRWRIVVFQK